MGSLASTTETPKRLRKVINGQKGVKDLHLGSRILKHTSKRKIESPKAS